MPFYSAGKRWQTKPGVLRGNVSANQSEPPTMPPRHLNVAWRSASVGADRVYGQYGDGAVLLFCSVLVKYVGDIQRVG